jgi:hypothetical protein
MELRRNVGLKVKKKQETGEIFVIFTHRSISLYVTRTWLLKISCEVSVAKSDVKNRSKCEDINVDPK